MFSKLHERFGAAGLVVAVLALVVALAGTAFAAASLTGKQKKEVKKIAKQFAGKNGKDGAAGPPGSVGPQGAKGDTGAKGETGAPGKNGTDGADGEDGACSVSVPKCELPPKATLTGTWGFSGLDDPEFVTAINFGMSIPQVPDDTNVKFINQSASEPASTECPGNVDKPKAAPGFLCLYESSASRNLSFINTDHQLKVANHGGVTIEFHPEAVGIDETTKGIGTWAVTAP